MSESVDSLSENAYVVNMTTAPPLRLSVIDPHVIGHVMEHPARGERWTVRELAALLGCSIGTLSHMRTGGRDTVPYELARRFSEAVGVEMAVLFMPPLSAESDTTTESAA